MTLSIKVFKSIENLSEEFCLEFFNVINNKQNAKGKINIALSGGNTPKFVFQNLAEFYKERLKWGKINLFWGDERCVPPEDPDSNFGMTKKYLLDHITIPSENIKRIIGENNPQEEAKRYSQVIKSSLPSVNILPKFDMVILGLGDDGHTASIFPDQIDLLKSDKIYEVAYQPASKQKRITITGKIINNSPKIYFLVTGKKKSYVVNKILNKKDDYLKFPASHIKPVMGELIWFLDAEAASEINN